MIAKFIILDTSRKHPEMIMSQFDKNFMSGAVAVRKVLEVPTVTTVIETGVFADTNNNFAFSTWPLLMTRKCGWEELAMN